MKKLDIPLLIATILLFFFGLIMILSASSVSSFMLDGNNAYYYLWRQAIFLVAGTIATFIVLKIPSQYYRKLSGAVLVIICFALVWLIVAGEPINGVKSWLILGPFTLQPSEFAKVFMIVFMSSNYEHFKNKLNAWNMEVLLPLAAVVVIGLLIFFQPDYGTLGIFGIIMLALFASSPVESKQKQPLLKLIGLGAAIIFFIISINPHLILSDRIINRLNTSNVCSEERFYLDGNQLCNGYIAINNGGLFGVGLGQSTQKYLYLPYPYTDFIVAILVEETGLVGLSILLLLYFFVIYRIMLLNMNSKKIKTKMITFGVSVYILAHIFVNIGGVFGIIGMTGVPLPFMSYGGSFTLSLIFALAVVQRLYKENEEEKYIIKKRTK